MTDAILQEDRTFHEASSYGSTAWVSLRLGMSKDTFFKKRDALERRGFPRRDPLTGLYLKMDVDAWIEARRVLGDGNRKTEVNHDAL